MTERTEPFNPLPKTSLTHADLEKKISLALLLRASSLLVGASFFCIILLLGINTAFHLSTTAGVAAVTVVFVLMLILIAQLTVNLIIKIRRLKTEALEADQQLAQTQIQELLKIFSSIQQTLSSQQKESHTKEKE